MPGSRFKFLLFLLILVVSSIEAKAQNASILGSVVDPTGAAVVGAHVTLSGHGTVQNYTSDDAGKYRFSSLAAGTYVLSVEAQGFSRYENSAIHISGSHASEGHASANDTLYWTVTLALQSGSQSIVVQGEAWKVWSRFPQRIRRERFWRIFRRVSR